MSALGRATEETVRDALSISEAFLREVKDVDGVFRGSKAAYLGLVANIMALVNKDTDMDATEAECLVDLRNTLVKKFARLKGSWENLLQSSLNFDESVVFTSILELVELQRMHYFTQKTCYGSLMMAIVAATMDPGG